MPWVLAKCLFWDIHKESTAVSFEKTLEHVSELILTALFDMLWWYSTIDKYYTIDSLYLLVVQGSVPGAQGSHASDDAELLRTFWRVLDAQHNEWETTWSWRWRSPSFLPGAPGKPQGENVFEKQIRLWRNCEFMDLRRVKSPPIY